MSRDTRFEVSPDVGVLTLPRHPDEKKRGAHPHGRRVSAEDGIITAEHEAEDRVFRALGDAKLKGKYGRLHSIAGTVQPIGGSTVDPALLNRANQALMLHVGEAGLASLKDSSDADLLSIKHVAEKTLPVARGLIAAAVEAAESGVEGETEETESPDSE